MTVKVAREQSVLREAVHRTLKGAFSGPKSNFRNTVRFIPKLALWDVGGLSGGRNRRQEMLPTTLAEVTFLSAIKVLCSGCAVGALEPGQGGAPVGRVADGRGRDYLTLRDQLFEGESVASLFEEVQAYQERTTDDTD